MAALWLFELLVANDKPNRPASRGGNHKGNDVNFYKHHLGDYAQATAHLTFIEDAAYSRLLRKYYADEKPLPVEIKACQRLVGARTEEEKEAVEIVLNEFFELQEDGWHNKRCDKEIAACNEQAKTNQRIALEREARKRATKEAQNVAQQEHEACENEHEPLENREPSQDSKTPRLQDTKTKTKPSSSASTLTTVGPSTDAAPPSSENSENPEKPPDKPQPTRAGLLAMTLRAQGIDTASTRAEIVDWAKRDIPDTIIAEAVTMAKNRKPNQRISSAYLAPIVEQLLNPPEPKRTNGEPNWWMSEKGIETKARELGCWPARAGETFGQLAQRIREKMGGQSV